ncbi:uncharacterized protein LOC102804670 [Saccoglossus kowalevskii]|uniref:Uncharacterized protein LOC102804670 n=1 Tax=Saccoglossus kowalevskii TaxID=10224 RepID=A0ABM0MK92_SACKO|nr:PREDICTED: uncharacterized protein LOC102804670 [Saccoglossus kowalevskii]
MDRTNYINDWKRLLEGLNLYNIDEIVNDLLDNGYTVTELRNVIETKGNDVMMAALRKIISNALVLKHIIGRVELSYMKKDCDKSISVSDIQRIIQCYQSYIHPEDRKLLQAAVTCVAKEIPSKALTDAEIVCASETMQIVFRCGTKENMYLVVRNDGKNKFAVVRGMANSPNMSSGLKWGIGVGIALGAILGGLAAGPLGYAIAIKASGAVVACAAGSGSLTAVAIGGGAVVVIEGVVAGAAAGAVAGAAAGCVIGGGAGIAASFITNVEWKMIKDE